MRGKVVYTPMAVLLVFLAFAASPADAGGEACSTRVSLTPTLLNALPYKMITGTIDIGSEFPDTFKVSIEGVPEGWIDYPRDVYVDCEETVNFMISPRKSGNYELSIRVSGGGKTFDLEERLWVGRMPTYEPGEKDTAGTSGGLTGMFVLGDIDTAPLLSAGIMIAAVAAVVLGFLFFREANNEWLGL